MQSQFHTYKSKLRWVAFGLLLLLGSVSVFSSTLVEPGKFILVLKPGERVTDTINVKNVSDKPTVVKAVVYDWTLDDQDELVTSTVGTRKDSLNESIKFNPRTFKLEPGANQLVRFTITAPKTGSAGEMRGIVFFEEESMITDQGVNAKLVTQVGTTIYATIAPFQLKLRLSTAKIVTAAGGQVSGVLTFRNEGSSHARYTITYKVVNEKNALVSQGQEKERVLLPGFQREVTFPVSGSFPAGKYNLLLEVKFFNTTKTLVHSIPFVIGK